MENEFLIFWSRNTSSSFLKASFVPKFLFHPNIFIVAYETASPQISCYLVSSTSNILMTKHFHQKLLHFSSLNPRIWLFFWWVFVHDIVLNNLILLYHWRETVAVNAKSTRSFLFDRTWIKWKDHLWLISLQSIDFIYVLYTLYT